MTDFQLFIEKNCIQKKALADYLKVTPAFITQLCNDSRKLPEEKLNLIIANRNWDTSMLCRPAAQQDGNGIIIQGANNMENSSIVNDHRQYTSESPDVLRHDIERLETIITEKETRIREKDTEIAKKDEQIAKKDEQIAKKDEQIDSLLEILKKK